MSFRRLIIGTSCATLALLLVGCGARGGQQVKARTDPGDRIESIRPVGDGVEIALSSRRPFPVRNDFPVLTIGTQQFDRSRYPEDGDTHILIFSLSSSEYDRLKDGDQVTVRYSTEATSGWQFGPLKKG